MSIPGIAQCLTRRWYRPGISAALLPLLPFSWLFHLLSGIRRGLYRFGILRTYRLPVPVVVVGNLTVGGSGKTPLVLWLVERLHELGWRPGIISRGHGGEATGEQEVVSDSDSMVVGDEPLLLAKRSGVPVFVGRDRFAAGQALLAMHPECNLIISDDGLQHYRLQRAVEIAVFDSRVAGNERLLPAGPLREPLSRLSQVTAVVWNDAREQRRLNMGTRFALPQFSMRLLGDFFVSLTDAQHRVRVDGLRGKRLYAIAGIGDTSRFFSQLTALGLEFEAHPFPDHFAYCAEDLAFAQGGVLLMTEKDAVKCANLTLGESWVLPVAAQIDPLPQGNSLLETILEKCNGRSPA